MLATIEKAREIGYNAEIRMGNSTAKKHFPIEWFRLENSLDLVRAFHEGYQRKKDEIKERAGEELEKMWGLTSDEIAEIFGSYENYAAEKDKLKRISVLGF